MIPSSRPRRVPCRAPRQGGYTLLELMIASLLGLILLAGVLQVYIGSKQSYRVNEALAQLQEAGRFATEFIARDARMADFWGCTRFLSSVSNDLNSSSDFAFNFLQGGVVGTDGNGLNGSDSIIFGGAYATGVHVKEPYMPTVSSSLHVSPGTDLTEGDIVLVSDCQAGDIFQITNINSTNSGSGPKLSAVHNTGASVTPGNASGDLSKTYDGRAHIYRVARREFQIQEDAATGLPTLHRRTTTAVWQPLVPGVEDLQIEYGEDTDGNFSPNYYVPANQVLDMEDVVALRLQLLTVSEEDNLAPQPQTYTFNGVEITATDRRLRQVYTTTVSLRNRLP